MHLLSFCLFRIYTGEFGVQRAGHAVLRGGAFEMNPAASPALQDFFEMRFPFSEKRPSYVDHELLPRHQRRLYCLHDEAGAAPLLDALWGK